MPRATADRAGIRHRRQRAAAGHALAPTRSPRCAGCRRRRSPSSSRSAGSPTRSSPACGRRVRTCGWSATRTRCATRRYAQGRPRCTQGIRGRAEARRRDRLAGRRADHGGARRGRRRHDRRHPRGPRARPRRRRHRHRRRRSRLARRRRARDPDLLPGAQRGVALAEAHPARRRRADHVRRHAGDAGRRDRRRRGGRGRPAGRAGRGDRPRRASSRRSAKRGRSSACSTGESIRGVYPIADERRAEYERWLADPQPGASRDEQPLRRRSVCGPRRDHAARDAVHRGRRARPGRDQAARRLAARAGHARHLGRRLDRRADVADGRGAHRGHARRGRGDRRARAVPPGDRQRADGRDARADRGGAAPRRSRGAGRHPLLRACPAGGPVPVVLARRVRVPRPADHRLQRARPGRGRHRAGDRRPPTPRARQHRRHQGDDARLRARLLRPERGRYRLHRAVGHRAALLPDALPRRRRPSQLRGQLRTATGRASSTTRSSPAITSGPAPCTTTCTRSSMPPSPRPTPFPSSGSWSSSACLPPGWHASRSRRSAPPRRSASARFLAASPHVELPTAVSS